PSTTRSGALLLLMVGVLIPFIGLLLLLRGRLGLQHQHRPTAAPRPPRPLDAQAVAAQVFRQGFDLHQRLSHHTSSGARGGSSSPRPASDTSGRKSAPY